MKNEIKNVYNFENINFFNLFLSIFIRIFFIYQILSILKIINSFQLLNMNFVINYIIIFITKYIHFLITVSGTLRKANKEDKWNATTSALCRSFP